MKDRMMKNISGNCFAMPKNFIERTDQNIAEFVADRINAEISMRRNN